MNPVRQAALGLRILRDWLGAGGKPVPIDQAQIRADICLSCPHNYQGSWIWNAATAMAIGSQENLLNTMKIPLKGEQDLAVCDICGCKLRLKVHTPFEHIYRHTSDLMFEKYPPHCWQKIELNQIKKQ